MAQQSTQPATVPSGYSLDTAPPTPQEYVHIRTIAGLTPPPESAVQLALTNSVHCIVLRTTANPDNPSISGAEATSEEDGKEGGKLVGMVRLIGDGALFCQIVDMAVDPAHQGRGLGKLLLGEMLRWVDEHAPLAYVSLIADAPGQPLYRSKGFVETGGIGMKRSSWGR